MAILQQTRVHLLPRPLPGPGRGAWDLRPREQTCLPSLNPVSLFVGNNWVGGKQLGCNWVGGRQVGFNWGSGVQQPRYSDGLARNSYEKSGSGSMYAEDDTMDYLEVHVVEAVSMVPIQGHLYMTFANGREVEVDHINPSKGRLLYKSSTPTIFLKVMNDSDLILPIVVNEGAVSMLMKALRDEENSGRPNCYHLMKDMVGALNYEARMVRITERVMDTYYARIYIGRPGEEGVFSVDARPSDAVNLAVRCKVPIYVNKSIIKADAVSHVYDPAVGKRLDISARNRGSSFWDTVNNEPDPIAEEITLMKSMLMAVIEERYSDAAHWRDELTKLRRKSKRQLRQI